MKNFYRELSALGWFILGFLFTLIFASPAYVVLATLVGIFMYMVRDHQKKYHNNNKHDDDY